MDASLSADEYAAFKPAPEEDPYSRYATAPFGASPEDPYAKYAAAPEEKPDAATADSALKASNAALQVLGTMSIPRRLDWSDVNEHLDQERLAESVQAKANAAEAERQGSGTGPGSNAYGWKRESDYQLGNISPKTKAGQAVAAQENQKLADVVGADDPWLVSQGEAKRKEYLSNLAKLDTAAQQDPEGTIKAVLEHQFGEDDVKRFAGYTQQGQSLLKDRPDITDPEELKRLHEIQGRTLTLADRWAPENAKYLKDGVDTRPSTASQIVGDQVSRAPIWGGDSTLMDLQNHPFRPIAAFGLGALPGAAGLGVANKVGPLVTEALASNFPRLAPWLGLGAAAASGMAVTKATEGGIHAIANSDTDAGRAVKSTLEQEPGMAQAGSLASILVPAAGGAAGLLKAGNVVRQAEGIPAAAKFVATRAGVGAGLGIGVDAALHAGATALGVEDGDYTANRAFQAAALGAVISGLGLNARNLSAEEIANIVLNVNREAATLSPGQTPGSTIDMATGKPINSPADVEVWKAVGSKLNEIKAKGFSLIQDPEKFRLDVSQALHGEAPIGKIAVKTGPVAMNGGAPVAGLGGPASSSAVAIAPEVAKMKQAAANVGPATQAAVDAHAAALTAQAQAALNALTASTPAPASPTAPAAPSVTPSAPAAASPPAVAPSVPASNPDHIDYSVMDTGGGTPLTHETEDNTPDQIVLSDTKAHPVRELEVSSLKLSEDVPNFKEDADPSTGVVEGQALSGGYERLGTAPIVVWQRNNGNMEVITGRHRLDLARRTGEKTIPAQVVKESDGFTKDKALTYDAESNIRDGQGSVKDYATYFRESRFSRQSAESRGLLSRVKGRDGWSLGVDASNDTFAAYAAGRLKERQAIAIAKAAPHDANMQRAGVKFAMSNPSATAEDVKHRVNAAAAFESAGLVEQDAQGDLFGVNDSAIQAMEKASQTAKEFEAEALHDVKLLLTATNRKGSLELTTKEANRLGIRDEARRDSAVIYTALEVARGKAEGWDTWHLDPRKRAMVMERAGTPEASKPKPILKGETEQELQARIEKKRQAEEAALAQEEAQRKADQAESDKNQVDMFGDTFAAVKTAGNDIIAGIENPPDIQTVQSAEDAPFGLFDGAEASSSKSDGLVQEAWHVVTPDGRRTIVLVADGIAQVAAATGKTVAQRAAEVTWHELVHDRKAIGALLPNNSRTEYRAILEGAIKLIPATEAQQIAADEGFDATTPEGREELGEEILAREREKPIRAKWYDGIVNAIMSVFRRLGAKWKLTRAELSVLLDKVRLARAGTVRETKTGTKSSVRTIASLDAEYSAAVKSGDKYKVRGMVDEAAFSAGYTHGVKHGTHSSRSFTEFDRNGAAISNSTFDLNRWGIWTTDDNAAARLYGDKVLDLYGKMQNPRRFQTWDEWFSDYVDHAYPLFAPTDGRADLSKDIQAYAVKTYGKTATPGTKAYRQMLEEMPGANAYRESLRNAGQDGVLIEGDFVDGELQTIRVFLDPEQLKSADLETHDAAGNLVPLSERFKPDAANIYGNGGTMRVKSSKRNFGDKETKQAQVFSEKGVGHVYEVRKVDETTARIRSQVFDGTQEPSPATTDAAWDLSYRWAAPATRLMTGAMVETAGGNVTGVSIAQAELMRYAHKLAESGDAALQSFLQEHINRFPDASGSDVSSAAALVGGRRVLASPALGAIRDISKMRDTLADETIGADAVQGIRDVLLQPGAGMSVEELLEGLNVKATDGRTLAETLHHLIGLGQTVDANPMIQAMVQMARRGYAGHLDFSFTAEAKKDADIAANLQPVLMNMREFLEKQGAKGLERDWWRGLAGPAAEKGALWTAHAAMNGQLSGILREAMKEAGIVNVHEATRLTDAEKIAQTLGQADLRGGKIELVSEKVAKDLKSREKAETAAVEADETIDDAAKQGMLDAISAHYAMLNDAWEQATSRMKGQPAAAGTIRRMVHQQVKDLAPSNAGGHPATQKFWRDAIESGKIAEAKAAIVSAIVDQVQKASGAHTEGLDYGPLTEQVGKAFDEVAGIQQARHETNEIGKRVAEQARIAARPEKQADSILSLFSKLQSDTPDLSADSPSAYGIKNLFYDNLSGKRISLTEDQFKAEALKLGVSEPTAEKMWRVMDREKRARVIAHENRKVIRAMEHGSLAPLVEMILNTPPHQQNSPEWREQAALTYLENAGLSPEQAKAAASSFAPQFTLRLAEAREKASERVLRGTAKWQETEKKNRQKAMSDLDKIRRAVRAGVTDPTVSFAEELAKAKGWRGFTPEQHQRLAVLDGIMSYPEISAHEKAKAGSEMMKITRRANVPPSVARTMAAGISFNILSGISSLYINVVSPAFFGAHTFLTDMAFSGSPLVCMRATMQRARTWFAEFFHALKTDSHSFGHNEWLDASGIALEQWLEEGWDGVLRKKPASIIKWFFGLPDLARRMHSALDQAAVAQANDYHKIMFASDAMSAAGLSSADVHNMISLAQDQQEMTFEAAREAGMGYLEAKTEALDAFRDYLAYAVGGISPERALELDAAARREGLTQVGRRDVGEDGKPLSDGTVLTRAIDMIVKGISGIERMVEKSGLDRARKESTLAFVTGLKRLFFGFIAAPWNVSVAAMVNMPLHGAWREVVHLLTKNGEGGTSYQQSRGTSFQVRQRRRELALNTVLVALIVKMLRPSDEPDDKKGDNWFTATGQGPATDDKGYQQIWRAKNKLWSLRGKLMGVKFEMNIGRGGEVMAYPIAALAAYDDWHVADKQRGGDGRVKAAWDGITIVSNYASTLWQRAAFGSQFGRTGVVMSRSYSSAPMVTDWAASFAKNVLPLQRFGESLSGLFAGQADTSSVKLAALANIPYVGPIMAEPALNVLGQKINDDAPSRFWKAGFPFLLRVEPTPENRVTLNLLLDKGQAPAVPNRNEVEKAFGPMDQATWRAYMQTYGGFLTDKLVERYDQYDEMDAKQFNDAMEKLSHEARDFTKSDLGLEQQESD